jgi:hypothetical protein
MKKRRHEMRTNTESFAEDPMEWREFLDTHRELPLWVRFISRLRYVLGI